jgi:hypothetical protein
MRDILVVRQPMFLSVKGWGSLDSKRLVFSQLRIVGAVIFNYFTVDGVAGA